MMRTSARTQTQKTSSVIEIVVMCMHRDIHAKQHTCIGAHETPHRAKRTPETFPNKDVWQVRTNIRVHAHKQEVIEVLVMYIHGDIYAK